jgi:hypothetical protein
MPSTLTDEDNDELNDSDKKLIHIISDKNLRKDYIVGGIFSLILIFAIIIFQKIFNEESKAIVTKEGPVLQNKIEPITNEDLLKDYILDTSSEELLSISPPFFIKIKTLENTAYTFINDSLTKTSRTINANQEKNLEPFVNTSELIFSTTKGLTLYINATEIKQITGYGYPIRIIINPKPSSLSIQRYKPLVTNI